jgi:hypothetical protein
MKERKLALKNLLKWWLPNKNFNLFILFLGAIYFLDSGGLE